MIRQKTSWEFACEWYGVDEIHRSLTTAIHVNEAPKAAGIPTNPYSREFAQWLTEQYRLAMNKGIEIGRECEAYSQ